MSVERLVCGIGFNNREYPTKNCVYNVWRAMIYRCTQNCWEMFPTYTGVTCTDSFKSYSYFYEWYHKQQNHNTIDYCGNKWCLDKDLLVKGNKIYSEDTCIFIPERINTLLTTCKASRGEMPVGVCFNKQRGNYKTQCNIGKGVSKHLGLFATKEEAFLVYKTFKEALIKEVANEYRGQLAERAYEALMKYEVNIDD